MKLLFWSTIFMAVCVVRAPAQLRVPETDTQSWNDVQFTVPMTKKVDFVLLGTLRLGDNLTTPVDERFGFGFNYKLNKYVTLTEAVFGREAKLPLGAESMSYV
jgi:hypothetical protein